MPWSRRWLPCILLFKFNIVNLKQVVGEIHCVFIGERHVWPLAVHFLERCVWRSDLLFMGGFRGVIAESSRSRRGVVAESVPGSLFFVGQNGGVAVESSRSRSSPRHGGSRSGLVFNRWDGGVGAESARSRRGVIAGPLRESLCFVGRIWAPRCPHKSPPPTHQSVQPCCIVLLSLLLLLLHRMVLLASASTTR